jgi:hypothetical protein
LSSLPAKRGKYNILSPKLKQLAIDLVLLDKLPIPSVCSQLQISSKNLHRWLQSGPLRKKGAGRKIQDLKMEEKLVQWMREQ